MAKNYKRHSQGKGFRKSDFGDMGLRAYREQQQTIINAQKLNNKEFELARKEFIDSDILKSRKEDENRKELQKLENNVFDVKFKNTKIRADREIEVLEQQAKESEQKSKFWVDFSTTYAKQYTQAAQDIYGTIDLKRQQKFINEHWSTPEFLEKLQNTEHIHNIQASDLEDWAQKNFKEKQKFLAELRPDVAEESDIGDRSSRIYHQLGVAKLKEDAPIWEGSLKKAIEEQGEKITKDNVNNIYEIQGLKLLQNYGIPLNSKAAYDFMKFVRKKGMEQVAYKTGLHNQAEDQNNINKSIQYLKTAKNENNDAGWEFTFNRLMRQVGTQTKFNKSTGTFGITPLNPMQRYLAAAEVLAENGIITNMDDADRWLNIPYPGQSWAKTLDKDFRKARDERKTWWDKHPEKTGLQENLRLIIAEGETAKNKEKEKIKNSTDRTDKAEIDAGISKKPGEEGYINLRDIDQMKTLDAKYRGRGNGKAYEYLQELKILGNMGTSPNGAILNSAAFTALAGEGKVQEFKRIVGLLEPKTQKEYASMIESYEFADRVGWDKKGKTKHLQAALSRITGLEDVTKLPPDSDYNRMFKDAEQVFNSLITKYGSNPKLNDVQKEENISRDLRELIGEKDGEGKTAHGSSIFRRKVVNGKVKWLAYHDEPNKLTDDSVIYDIINTKGTENFLKQITLDTSDIRLFTQDDFDTLNKSILRNLSLETVIPKRIRTLVDSLWDKQSKKHLTQYQTKTQILNKLLKAGGSDVEIPPSEEEHNLFETKNYEVLIPGYLEMKPEDQLRVACAQTILDLADTEACKERVRKDEEADRIRQEILDASRNLSPNLRKDGSGDRWDTLNPKEQLEFEKLLKV